MHLSAEERWRIQGYVLSINRHLFVLLLKTLINYYLYNLLFLLFFIYFYIMAINIIFNYMHIPKSNCIHLLNIQSMITHRVLARLPTHHYLHIYYKEYIKITITFAFYDLSLVSVFICCLHKQLIQFALMIVPLAAQWA